MRRFKTLLAASAIAIAAPAAALASRGGDGTVNILFWQAPSILNPYLSGGEKDTAAASLILEPLAGYDQNGKIVPRLAVEIPTLENGGVSKDLKSITWKLRPDLKWSDGTPVTASDVVFTANYCMNPKGGCAQLSAFEGVTKVEALDNLTVRIVFNSPTAVPYGPLVGSSSPIIQAKQFADCVAEKAPTCTEANFNPIGTGPFVVTSFKPNDAIEMKANQNYRDPAKPAFDSVYLKGGGDALGAARAVLQTGEFDYSYDLRVAPNVLKKMAETGKGKLIVDFGAQVEILLVNLTDASPSLPPDDRSTLKHLNPILGDVRVRRALSMAIDRGTLVKVGYGFMGKATCDLVPAPADFAAGNTDCLNRDVEGAKELLDQAGWKVGSDGIREKDGTKLKLVFQTSTNTVRQQFQAIMKQWWGEIGVDVELRNIDSAIYFGSDPGSPDTYVKFYADLEMYADYFSGTDPGRYVTNNSCNQIPQPNNQWQGTNITRFCDERYDALVKELAKTADVEKRGAIVKQLNNILTKDSSVILPLVWRGYVSAISNTLDGYRMNVWDTDLWNAQDWRRSQ